MHPRHQKTRRDVGFSVLEVMIAIGFLAIGTVVAVTLFDHYRSNTLRAAAAGGDEDIRQFLRNNLDCKKTVLLERSTCKAGGLIRGYDKNGRALIANSAKGIDFGGNNVLMHCMDDGTGINVSARVRHKGSTDYQELFRIPLACKVCGVDITSNTMTFPPPPIPQTPGNLMAYLSKVMVDCGENSLGTQPIMRATGTSARGKDKPFNMGTPHLPTLKKVCDVLGFDTYVSSSCVEQAKDTRCNFTSPGDNWLWYWNGSAWARRGAPIYNHSWLSAITCADPR